VLAGLHRPGRARRRITVKRAGYASAWIADNVAAGTELDVLPPAGTFTPKALDADLLLFAGGSGITPVMSIVKSALARGRGRILLVYANRDEGAVIFGHQLRRMTRDNPRLLVLHWLDSLAGPPTAAAMAALASPHKDREAFVCGPDPYMSIVKDALGQLGVPAQRIHVERFRSLADNPFEERAPVPDDGTGTAATLEVTLDGERRVLSWPVTRRMLDVLIDEGLDAPFSCREGICGACACRVTGGEVKMAHNDVLDEADIADGYVLACQSLPLTDTVRITY
jgi:3-ketosteroid 9alpha-monooxygenase subunit B